MLQKTFLAVLVIFGVTSLSAGDALELKVEKGDAFGYRLQSSNEMSFEFGDRSGESQRQRQSQIQITVTGVADDGSITADVQLQSLKMSGTGRDGEKWEFDSTKKAADDSAPGAEAYRKALATQASVTVGKDGQVQKIEGLRDESEAEEEGDGERRRRRRFSPAEGILRADLAVIFGAGLQGKELEVGESYRIGGERRGRGDRGGARRGREGGGEGERGGRRRRGRPEEDDSLFARGDSAAQDRDEERPEGRRRRGGQDGEGRGRPGGQDGEGRRRGRASFGRGFGGGGFPFGLKLDKAPAGDQVTFALYARSFGRGRDSDEAPKPVGSAVYSKANGLLVSAQGESERENESDRGSFSSKTTYRIERADAAGEGAAPSEASTDSKPGKKKETF